MSKYFECTIKHPYMSEDGKVKQTSVKIVAKAVNFTDAETRAINYAQEEGLYSYGEYSVTAIRPVRYSENIESGDGFYFKVVVQMEVLVNDTKTKKVRTQMLVNADSIAQAKELTEERMKGTVSDWAICSIQETPVICLIN